ncbi:MAG: MMPL family transporter [Campylobacteraceae bacterium]|nr:MMPL family transporter [Campylobacteraceae bacterium]
MIRTFYDKYLLEYPKAFLSILFIIVVFFGFQSTKLEVDVSTETLLLENDKDLEYFREITTRYPSGLEMLIVSLAPNGDLLGQESLNSIEKIRNEFLKLEKVDTVMSILDVPLLEQGDGGIKELVDSITTLSSKDVNITRVKEELLNSPIYSQNLVSKDFKTTSIIVFLKYDSRYFELLDSRNSLRNLVESKNATNDDKKNLNIVSAQFKEYRDKLRVEEKNFINDARIIIKNYENDGKLFIGGVSMIAVDVISYVKSDVVKFGAMLFLLLGIVLYIIFRQIRFVVLPLFMCALSIIITAGILGFFSWEITVISSNFVALQLILTISIVLHLVVMYRELVAKYPKSSQKQLVLVTMLRKINPAFFAVLTTIIGFSSLIFSNIRPVINLGWMMGSGIAFSLLISLIVFPAIMVLLPKKKINLSFEKDFAFTVVCAKIVDKKSKYILFSAIFMTIFAIIGISKISVENSFINYFKKSTAIYKGMQNIDQNLGGTTPLDVIVKFKTHKSESSVVENDTFDEFDEFEDEYEQQKNSAQYWFTEERMQKAKEVHNYFEMQKYIGKVQSLGTMLKIGERLNNNIPFDSFTLALLYNNIPQEYKDIVLTPYLNIEHNELRFTMRIIDSDPELKRDELLSKMENDLKEIITPDVGEFRLAGAMVLYNNLLQSFFSSQILTLGSVALIFLIVFWPIFGSLKASIITIVSNIVPMSVVFGFMGFAGIPLDIMTITIAAISIGIGVDDAIHYIHRLKEELQKDWDYKAAMYRSHKSIGFAMYYTTLVTVLGFGVLVFSNFVPTMLFGLLTVVVMIMAFLGAILLLPLLLVMFKPFKPKQEKYVA